jgi:hypothetical protein
LPPLVPDDVHTSWSTTSSACRACGCARRSATTRYKYPCRDPARSRRAVPLSVRLHGLRISPWSSRTICPTSAPPAGDAGVAQAPVARSGDVARVDLPAITADATSCRQGSNAPRSNGPPRTQQPRMAVQIRLLPPLSVNEAEESDTRRSRQQMHEEARLTLRWAHPDDLGRYRTLAGQE